MYLYYFNADNGRSNQILVAKISKFKPYSSNCSIAYFDTDSEIYEHMRSSKGPSALNSYRVSVNEGVVYKRAFWLESYDVEKAEKIVADYHERKLAELHARLKRMEELA